MVKAKITVYSEKTEHPAKPDVVETFDLDYILDFLTSHGVDSQLAKQSYLWCCLQKDMDVTDFHFDSDTCVKLMRRNFMVELFFDSDKLL